jgi:hypothetical protein
MPLATRHATSLPDTRLSSCIDTQRHPLQYKPKITKPHFTTVPSILKHVKRCSPEGEEFVANTSTTREQLATVKWRRFGAAGQSMTGHASL